MKNVKLYYSDFCPHCTEPVKYVKDNNLDVELLNCTKDMKLQKEIYSVGGKSEVPMLNIDGQGMYNSKDIIQWLKENMK